MIEGSAFASNPVVGELEHELDQIVLITLRQAQRANRRISYSVVEVSPPIVEVDDVPQSQVASVVEIRTRKLNVSQARSLEPTAT